MPPKRKKNTGTSAKRQKTGSDSYSKRGASSATPAPSESVGSLDNDAVIDVDEEMGTSKESGDETDHSEAEEGSEAELGTSLILL